MHATNKIDYFWKRIMLCAYFSEYQTNIDYRVFATIVITTVQTVGAYIDGLVQERRNSRAIAIELRLSYTYGVVAKQWIEKCNKYQHSRRRDELLAWKLKRAPKQWIVPMTSMTFKQQ